MFANEVVFVDDESEILYCDPVVDSPPPRVQSPNGGQANHVPEADCPNENQIN